MKDIDEVDIEELLWSHDEDLNNENIQEIVNQTILEEAGYMVSINYFLEEEYWKKDLYTEFLICSITKIRW